MAFANSGDLLLAITDRASVRKTNLETSFESSIKETAFMIASVSALKFLQYLPVAVWCVSMFPDGYRKTTPTPPSLTALVTDPSVYLVWWVVLV